MTKLVSYSLFNFPTAEPFEKLAYIRGFYWNARMNNFIYPDWRTHLDIDMHTYLEFEGLWKWMVENNNLDLKVNDEAPALCAGMLWRMKPIFTIDISHVLCRDSDSITTYREALAVQMWLEKGNGVLSLHDNPSHAGLMGGMIGVNTAKFKALTGLTSWDEMVSGYDLSQRGSDQNLLNQNILPKIGAYALLSIGGKDEIAFHGISEQWPLPQVEPRLWESNLTCRHIGSAGVVDMEVIRFFKRFDIYQWKFDVIEKQFPKIFYWI